MLSHIFSKHFKESGNDSLKKEEKVKKWINFHNNKMKVIMP